MSQYRIEFYNQRSKRYSVWWKGNDFARAEIMFNKPYAQFATRRLIKTHEEILYIKRFKKSE